MSRSTGWDKVLNGIVNEEDCDPPNPETGFPGNCGNDTVGTTFMFTYLIAVAVMTLMMYAVIAYNYLLATKDAIDDPSDKIEDIYETAKKDSEARKRNPIHETIDFDEINMLSPDNPSSTS